MNEATWEQLYGKTRPVAKPKPDPPCACCGHEQSVHVKGTGYCDGGLCCCLAFALTAADVRWPNRAAS